MKRKTNKMITAFVLILAISVLAMGCGKQAKTETKEDTKKTTETTEEKKKTEEKEQEVPYEKGIRTDTSFESAWMNLKFTLPENYTMASQEEMEQLYNQSAADMDLTDAQKSAVNNVSYEMVAVNGAENVNVNIVVEKLSLASMSEETYITLSQKTVTEVSNGISYQVNGGVTDYVIGGENFKMGSMTAETQGIKLNQDFFAKKIGSYMIVMTVSYVDGAEASKDALLSAFQPYA